MSPIDTSGIKTSLRIDPERPDTAFVVMRTSSSKWLQTGADSYNLPIPLRDWRSCKRSPLQTASISSGSVVQLQMAATKSMLTELRTHSDHGARAAVMMFNADSHAQAPKPLQKHWLMNSRH